MLTINAPYGWISTLLLFMVIATAQAEPGDSEAVSKARKDYAEAMKGHDVGLQNAMKIELSVQLAKERSSKTSGDSATPGNRKSNNS